MKLLVFASMKYQEMLPGNLFLNSFDDTNVTGTDGIKVFNCSVDAVGERGCGNFIECEEIELIF